jgi:hypothetical protein
MDRYPAVGVVYQPGQLGGIAAAGPHRVLERVEG